MQDYKADFIEFLLATQALKFGDFTLKSGRRSPFFLNMGSFTKGSELKKLSDFYARAINEKISILYLYSNINHIFNWMFFK